MSAKLVKIIMKSTRDVPNYGRLETGENKVPENLAKQLIAQGHAESASKSSAESKAADSKSQTED